MQVDMDGIFDELGRKMRAEKEKAKRSRERVKPRSYYRYGRPVKEPSRRSGRASWIARGDGYAIGGFRTRRAALRRCNDGRLPERI